MKKTYTEPAIEELDFRDTATACGAAARKVEHSSGLTILSSSKECFNLNNWLFNWGTAFDDDDEEEYDEED